MDKIKLFKDRKIKAKEVFELKEISQREARTLVNKYHYLKGKRFMSTYNIGMYHNLELVGVASYRLPQGDVALKGWFGLDNSTKDILELSRLVVRPDLNGTNATSFLLSNSIKLLKRKYKIRAVITLADASRHVGSIYQVCNFEYYGLTNKKHDFYTPDGRKGVRVKTSVTRGVWIPRPRKHRYAMVLDKNLKPLYERSERPKKDDSVKYSCCGGSGCVYDKRFDDWYDCFVCNP